MSHETWSKSICKFACHGPSNKPRNFMEKDRSYLWIFSWRTGQLQHQTCVSHTRRHMFIFSRNKTSETRKRPDQREVCALFCSVLVIWRTNIAQHVMHFFHWSVFPPMIATDMIQNNNKAGFRCVIYFHWDHKCFCTPPNSLLPEHVCIIFGRNVEICV